MRKLTIFLNHVDVSKHIVCHLVGPNHTPVHHRLVGILVIIIGVVLTKASLLIGHLYEIPCDIAGWSLHAAGFIPFARGVEEKAEKAKLTKSVRSRDDQEEDENSSIKE